MLHPVRVTALAIAILATIFAGDDLAARADRDAEVSPIFATAGEGPLLEHAPVADPANLDAAGAERIYRAIRPQMQAGYAQSGDPLATIYSHWRRYNAVPYRSQQHGRVFVNNYANAAAGAYGQQGETGPLPAGSVIVKDSFVVTATGEIRAGPVAIMEKMPPGFDPANGDWRYLVIEPDGALIGVAAEPGADPRMAQCAACHAAAPKGQDRLFFVPRGVRR